MGESRLEEVKNGPRSVSQLKEWEKCPHSFRLNRIDRVWERPAAWLPQGLAVHEAAEAWEKSARTLPLDATLDVFRESYAKHTNRLAEDTPNMEFWFSSGPYQGPQDVERRYSKGIEQVGSYIRYYTQTAPQEVVWITPEGEPAIESGFEIDLDGVPVRGYIDKVEQHPKHGLMVDDLKTGLLPGDDFQLATYAVAINEKYGTDIDKGVYWMATKGKPTKVYDLKEWTKERVTEKFHKMDAEVKAEKFDPLPEE